MKVLIVGLGSVAKKHTSALKKLDNSVQIIALRSGADVAPETDVINIFSFDEIEKYAPDFAIISNPTSKHKETIERLLRFKFPLFIEKPLHSDLCLDSLIDLANSFCVPTYVACNLRFLDCIKYVKASLNSRLIENLNEVNVYCGSYLPDWRPGCDFRKIYSSNSEKGGGAHLDLIHELDYLYWFFGMPVKVTRVLKSNSTLRINSPDYANYILEYRNFCASIILNYYRRDAKRHLELVFEDDTWNVDLLKNRIYQDDKTIFMSEQRIQDTYYAQMDYFINSVLTGKESLNDISSAYNVLKICLTA